jgi:hypothetical protein
MKKLLIIFFAISTTFLVACGEDGKNNEPTKTEETDANLEVDKGLLNVEVTLPSTLFENTPEEEIVSNAEKEGFKDVKVNENGSVTYKMSKLEHEKLMDDMDAELKATIEELSRSEDYPSIKEISHNSDYTEFDVTVSKEQYENSFDGFAILTLAISGMYYGAFDGRAGDDLRVIFNLIDDKTNEVFDTSVYPDDLEEEAETEVKQK